MLKTKKRQNPHINLIFEERTSKKGVLVRCTSKESFLRKLSRFKTKGSCQFQLFLQPFWQRIKLILKYTSFLQNCFALACLGNKQDLNCVGALRLVYTTPRRAEIFQYALGSCKFRLPFSHTSNTPKTNFVCLLCKLFEREQLCAVRTGYRTRQVQAGCPILALRRSTHLIYHQERASTKKKHKIQLCYFQLRGST